MQPGHAATSKLNLFVQPGQTATDNLFVQPGQRLKFKLLVQPRPALNLFVQPGQAARSSVSLFVQPGQRVMDKWLVQPGQAAVTGWAEASAFLQQVEQPVTSSTLVAIIAANANKVFIFFLFGFGCLQVRNVAGR